MARTGGGVSWTRLAAVVVVGLVVWLLPSPAGITRQAWHLLAIFVATIFGLVVKPMPLAAVAFLGLSTTAITGTLTIAQALSSFSHPTIWLMVSAFFMSRGFIKTGLGARVAYGFVAVLGRRTLGLAYGLAATDLVLAPAIPSNTARAGGVLYPVVRSIAGSFQSEPADGSARRIGAFLITTAFQSNVITSAMFLTSMTANPLAADLAAGLGISLTWRTWALAAIVPGLLSLLVVPWLIYVLYPPEIRATPAAAALARGRLADMGPVTKQEWLMAVLFVAVVGLWIVGDRLSLHETTVALAGVAVLLIGGVLEWEDVLAEKGAWDVLIWFAALLAMATHLAQFGLVKWFADAMSGAVNGMGWMPAFLVVSLAYFYGHYFFASNTAHVAALYAPFLTVAVAAGAPPLAAALVLAFFSSLFSSMTHYGTGPAPMYFGSGYVGTGTWWTLGALISVVNILIWLGVGGMWWKVLGVW